MKPLFPVFAGRLENLHDICFPLVFFSNKTVRLIVRGKYPMGCPHLAGFWQSVILTADQRDVLRRHRCRVVDRSLAKEVETE